MIFYKNDKIIIRENTISSTVFLTNIIHLFYKDDNVYMYSFICLFLASVMYHQTYNNKIRIIDKIVMYNVVLQGGNRLYKNTVDIYTYITVSFFLSTVYIYYICNRNIYEKYHLHSVLHILGSLGHHLIISKC